MKGLLPIDASGSTWLSIVRYAEERIADLTDTCTSTGSTDLQRAVAAFQIEELKMLLDAPSRSKAIAEHRATHQPNEVY